MYKLIYVPGIGDDIGFVQSTLVRLWRLRGVVGITHVMPWDGPSEYDVRAKRLLKLISAENRSGKQVVLVGASAGASAVINAYLAERPSVAAVVLICPKINDSTNIGAKILKKNPTFLTSMQQTGNILNNLTAADKARIAIFLSPRDGLVARRDGVIPGVKTYQLAPLRHNAAILYALTFGFGQLKSELQKITDRA